MRSFELPLELRDGAQDGELQAGGGIVAVLTRIQDDQVHAALTQIGIQDCGAVPRYLNCALKSSSGLVASFLI